MSDKTFGYRYNVRHEFNGGEETYTFTSPIPLNKWYDDLEQQLALAKALGIDYEPHRKEYLILFPHDDTIEKVLTLEEANTILSAGQ